MPYRRERLPLQDSILENSMDCIDHGVAESQIQLSDSLSVAVIGQCILIFWYCCIYWCINDLGFPSNLVIKNLHAKAGDEGSILGQEDPLGEGMATHSSILARKIPLRGEPGGLWSIVSQRVWHDWGAAAAAYGSLLIGSARTFVNIRMLRKINRSLEHSNIYPCRLLVPLVATEHSPPHPTPQNTYTKNYF